MNILSWLMKGFFVSLLLISLCGCGDDDDDDNNDDQNPISDNNLIGTWNVTEARAVGTVSGIPVDVEATTSGTITFNANFTGKENYQLTVSGMTFTESDEFTWVSDDNTIVFDPNDPAETRWTRLINESDRQQATYQLPIGVDEVTITITVTK